MKPPGRIKRVGQDDDAQGRERARVEQDYLMLKSPFRFTWGLVLLLSGLPACAHLASSTMEPPPCVVPRELPVVRSAADARKAVNEGELRVDLDGDGAVDVALFREPSGTLSREELFASGRSRGAAAASVRERSSQASRYVRKSVRGRRSVEVIRREGEGAPVEYVMTVTDIPADLDQPVVRQVLRLGDDTGAALLSRSFDQDRDGFYGRSTQHVKSRVRPWEGPGALMLLRGDSQCGASESERLRTALDLAVAHGSKCLRELESPGRRAFDGASESSRSSESPDAQPQPGSSLQLDASDSSDEADEDSATGFQTAEERLRQLEWLWIRARDEVELACIPMPMCGAVDQADVARAWLGDGGPILFIGTEAMDEKRCGALSATVGRLLRLYDPASFDFGEESYDAFASCLDARSREEPACDPECDEVEEGKDGPDTRPLR